MTPLWPRPRTADDGGHASGRQRCASRHPWPRFPLSARAVDWLLADSLVITRRRPSFTLARMAQKARCVTPALPYNPHSVAARSHAA